MKLYAKILIFIAGLVGAALWVNIHFSRVAVSEAMSNQIADAAASAADSLAPDFRAAFESSREIDGIKALHAFAQRTGAVYAGMVTTQGEVVAHTNVALTGGTLSDPLTVRGLRSSVPVFKRLTHNGEEIVDAMLPVPPSRGTGEDILFEGVANGRPAGYLRAGLPLTPARKAEKEIIFSLLLLALAIGAVGLALSALFARLLLRQGAKASRRCAAATTTWPCP